MDFLQIVFRLDVKANQLSQILNSSKKTVFKATTYKKRSPPLKDNDLFMCKTVNYTFLVTYPLLRQRVHILTVMVVPPISVFTATIFGFQTRCVWLYDLLTLLPLREPFPQISHLLDITNLPIKYLEKHTSRKHQLCQRVVPM